MKNSILITDNKNNTLNNTFDEVANIENNENFFKLLDKKKKIYITGTYKKNKSTINRYHNKICWIYDGELSSLYLKSERNRIYEILEYLDRNLIQSIGFFDKNIYNIFKSAKYNTEYIEIKNKYNNLKYNYNSKTIGLLSDEYKPNENFYNQLAALSNTDYIVKLYNPAKKTLTFCKDFNINYIKVTSQHELITNNILNLYINFSNTKNEVIMESLAYNIPCIIGNTDFYSKNKLLNKYLTINTVDNIENITFYIKKIIENKDTILNEISDYLSLF